MSLRESLRDRWGLLIYVLSILGALIQLSNEKHWAHYRIFTRAANALWAGADPYYDTFNAGSGYWYYSPACGLFYYGLFSWLPETLGIYAYMISSIAILTVGIVAFLKACDINPFDRAESRWMNTIWFWVSFELNPGILSTKTEITMVGIVLLAGAALIRRKQLFGVGLAMAMIVNWKFQPLPTVGLLFVLIVMLRRGLRFASAFLLGLVFWFSLPGFWLGWERLSSLHERWFSSIKSAIEMTWREFMHVYRFLEAVLRVPLSYDWIRPISGVSAFLMAAIVLLWSRREIKRHDFDDVFSRGVPLAVALGSAFTVVFSPYGQSNAFVLYCPILIIAVLAVRERAAKIGSMDSRVLAANRIVNGAAFATSVLHSDVITKPGRVFVGTLGIKPIGSLLLIAVIVWFYFTRPETRLSEST